MSTHYTLCNNELHEIDFYTYAHTDESWNEKKQNSLDENETSFSQEAIASLDTDNELSNDLKEFGVDTDEPDLFNSDNQHQNSEDLLGSTDENSDEDDLEIPAFLRRQKN